MYTISGESFVSKTAYSTQARECIIFEKDTGNIVNVETKEKTTRFILVSGEPSNERYCHIIVRSFVQFTSFSMNSEQEILEALADFQICQNGFETASNWTSMIAKQLP